MSISQRLRTCAKHTGLDAVIELLQEAADEIDALQARDQVQGEPVAWCTPDGERCVTAKTMESAKKDGGAMLSSLASFTVPSYTIPQPAQATQAEVPDAELLDLFESRYPADGATVRAQQNGVEVACIDAISAKVGWTRFKNDARAILALRPERVPMTEDQVWHNDALMSANGTAGFKMDALMRIVRAAEAHRGITTKAKGEQ